jgi:hypothetical protein
MIERSIGSMNRHDGLGAVLEAFIREHEYCGEVDGLEDDRVWMTCTCGASICRNADHA